MDERALADLPGTQQGNCSTLTERIQQEGTKVTGSEIGSWLWDVSIVY